MVLHSQPNTIFGPKIKAFHTHFLPHTFQFTGQWYCHIALHNTVLAETTDKSGSWTPQETTEIIYRNKMVITDNVYHKIFILVSQSPIQSKPIIPCHRPNSVIPNETVQNWNTYGNNSSCWHLQNVRCVMFELCVYCEKGDGFYWFKMLAACPDCSNVWPPPN